MSDIATKLTYLNETKSQLKDMINYGLPTENQITNETTFRNYVKGIFEAFIESLRDSTTLYTNLPKISGNGTQITLNDTANAPMRITLKASELSQDATPTPSSPQDIHTISGDNSVVVSGANLFDKSTETIGYTLDLANGTLITASNRNTSDFISVKPSTKYCCSTTMTRIVYYNSNKLFISNEITKPSTTAPSNASYMRFSYDNTTISNIMLNEGNTTLPYEPYIEPQTAPINLDTIEYCKIGNYEDEFIRTSGKQLFDKDNVNVLNAYINASGVIINNTTDRTIWIKIEKNTDYTFQMIQKALSTSTAQDDMRIALFSSQPAFNSTGSIVYSATRPSTTSDYYFEYSFNSSDNEYVAIKIINTQKSNYDNTISTIMLNEGSTALPYEPYGTNQWYLKKNIGKVVLDGSETWNERTNASGHKQFHCLSGSNSVLTAQQLCNYFSHYNSPTIWNYGVVGDFAIVALDKSFICVVKNDLTLADFKTLLASNNLEVYYVLATPTYTLLNDTLQEQLNNIYEKLLSYKGTTNISQVNNDLPFVLGVSAIQDLE